MTVFLIIGLLLTYQYDFLIEEDVIFFVSYLSSVLLAIFIHELGHVILGMYVGHQFLFFTVGPFTIEKSITGLKLKTNSSWFAFGGISMMIPTSFVKEEMIKKEILYVAGGPAFSLLTSVISYIFYLTTGYSFLSYFSLMNLGLFLVTIFPTSTGNESDGYIIKKLWKRDQESMLWIEQMIRNKEMMSPLRPKQWNKESILTAKKNSTDWLSAVMVYYYEIDSNNFKVAKETILENFELQIPERVDVKLANFTQMHQLSLFFSGESELERIKKLQEKLSPLETVSFERGKAIIAFLENNSSKAKKHIKKSDDVISKGINKFGFFYAEKKLNQLVKNEMNL